MDEKTLRCNLVHSIVEGSTKLDKLANRPVLEFLGVPLCLVGMLYKIPSTVDLLIKHEEVIREQQVLS